jgi:hypothetical protein
VAEVAEYIVVADSIPVEEQESHNKVVGRHMEEHNLGFEEVSAVSAS